MGIEANFNIDSLFEGLSEKVDLIIVGVLEAMGKTCLEVTIAAKQLNTYQDQTNNLRSSIGYVVYSGGEKIAEYFNKDGAGIDGNGTGGIAKGIAVANQAAREHPDEIIGVIVAGEDYALYVESKGLDVLTGPCSQLAPILEKNLRLVFDNLQ